MGAKTQDYDFVLEALAGIVRFAYVVIEKKGDGVPQNRPSGLMTPAA
jgi:hypothetical protein